MNAKRRIEMFSAGCPACEDTIALINRVACAACEVSVLDMHNPDGRAGPSAWVSARCLRWSSTANWRSAVRGEVLTSRPSGRWGLGSRWRNGSGHESTRGQRRWMHHGSSRSSL